MEEGNDKMHISRGDLIALSQEFSDRDVKYARLEMMYQMEQEKNKQLTEQLSESEAERRKAEEKNCGLEIINEQLRRDLEAMKVKIDSIDNSIKQPDRELLQQAVEFLLQKHLLISIFEIQQFMKDKVSDLSTAMLLRGFVLTCVPEQLLPTALNIINKVMVLPNKPNPIVPIENRTINLTGSDAIYNENPKE
jgi:hypothetical protein